MPRDHLRKTRLALSLPMSAATRAGICYCVIVIMTQIISADLGTIDSTVHELALIFVAMWDVQLAAQWLVLSSGDVNLFLQREIGLSALLAAIQTYCLKVSHDASSCTILLSKAAVAAPHDWASFSCEYA